MNEEVGPNLFLSGAATGVNTFIVSSRLVNRKLPVFKPILLILGHNQLFGAPNPTFSGTTETSYFQYLLLLLEVHL